MAVPALAVPICADEHGVMRIADTRVTRSVVIARFQQGYTPEHVKESFPTLKLADIYAVITYYLNNRDELDAYLHQQRDEADAIQRDIEAKQPKAAELRARLRAHRTTTPSE